MFRYLADLVDPFAPDAHETSAPETPPARVWPFLKQELRPMRRVMALSLLATCLSVAVELWLVWLAGRMVDLVATTPRETFFAELGPRLALLASGVLVLRALADVAKEATDDIAFRPNAVSLIRWRAHRHLLRQPVGWFREEPSGRLGARVRELGIAGAGVAYAVLHTLAYVVLYIAGSLVLLTSVDPRLAWPILAWLALYLAHMAWVVPRFRDNTQAFNEALSGLTGLFVDTYANIETVKLYSPEEDAAARRGFRAARATFLDVQRMEVLINTGSSLIATLLLLGLTGQAIWLWSEGAAEVGIVAASIALALRLGSFADWMLDGVSSLFGWIGATRDALSSIARPLALKDAPGAPALAVRGGEIRFDAVTHHYGRGTGGPEGLSLTVAPGEKLGLVGPSGAGKSTLVSLLLRHYDPEGGRVLIDGQDVRGVTQASLHAAVALVAQEPALLDRSVAENIGLGRAGDRAAVERVAEQARAAGFIAGLRDAEGRQGYDARVGERGIQLSGGQRQRIALARALMKDAPVLVLDEATSALDSESEAAVLDTLYPMMEGKTVIAIAHRLSTIARMDRIAVVDGGRIVETGTHAELLAGGGLYARLWARQSEGFLP
ncbi:ABC transporter ATP-binding protein [Pseudoroseicyclus sp. CXY001]|uniref:ABC transporter ATP-binding protein n=1 Tax=Pseudoroseicyclus sp. CXY001 TaxID=3242492 RepID=UPI003570D561